MGGGEGTGQVLCCFLGLGCFVVWCVVSVHFALFCFILFCSCVPLKKAGNRSNANMRCAEV